jgi:hypothetical protein
MLLKGLKMSAYDQIIQEVLNCQPDSLSAEILDSSRPIVLRGIINQWPVVNAAKESSEQVLDYLSQFTTDEPLTVFRGDSNDDGRIFYNSDFTGI